MVEKNNIKEESILQKYVDKKAFIKLFISHGIDEETISGIILDMSGSFLLIHEVCDFMFDGYAIVKREDIDRIRHSRFELAQRKILKAEGILDTSLGYEKPLVLTNWKSIFAALKKDDKHVIIQNTYKNYLDYWIGGIKRVTEKGVSIHNYDPTGKLDSQAQTIHFQTIKILRFGNRYSTIFRKYLKPVKSEQT